MKLEIKHLAPYLPYRLSGMAKHLNNAPCELAGVGKRLGPTVDIDIDEGRRVMSYNCGISNFTPFLRPLSELTREQMIVIAKLIGDIHNDDVDSDFICKNDGRMVVKTPWDQVIEFMYQGKTIMFTARNTWHQKELRVWNVKEAIEYLYSHHFDLGNLIGNNLAVNINDIK